MVIRWGTNILYNTREERQTLEMIDRECKVLDQKDKLNRGQTDNKVGQTF